MARPDVQHWLTRELQALLLESDVSLVARHIQGYIQRLPQARFTGSERHACCTEKTSNAVVPTK